MQSGSMEALTPREGKHGQDHGDHGPGYRAAGSSGAPPGAEGINISKKPGSGSSPLHEALRSTGGREVPGHRAWRNRGTGGGLPGTGSSPVPPPTPSQGTAPAGREEPVQPPPIPGAPPPLPVQARYR